MVKDISIDKALAMENAVYIDVRSPKEFSEDSLPSAYNVPILDNEERALVGIVYKHQGPLEARNVAMELVASQIPAKIKQIREIAQGRDVVLYCWRGGLRSKVMAQLLDLVAFPCYRLIGGYKAYRKYVNEFFNHGQISSKMIVLYGLTGVGKTEIIQRLISLGVPAIDLEGMANHRGSVFGNVGLGQQPSQKKFESMLFTALQKYKNSKAIVVEGESRKIGRLTIPRLLYDAMQKGIHGLVYDSLENRVKRICQEYVQNSQTNLLELESALRALENRIGKAKSQMLIEQLYAGEFEKVVEYLLLNYYDLLYRHPDKPSPDYAFSINASNIERAAEEIKNYIDNI